MTTRTAAAPFALLCALSLPIAAQVANPGFEDAREAVPTMPGAWRVIGDGGTVSLDTAYRYAGKQSVRIQKLEGARFTGVGQDIDAKPWRGKIVRLTAHLRAEGLSGGSAALWLRTGGGGKRAIEFTSAAFQPAQESADWTLHRALITVDDAADQLHFGATLAAGGVLWVDTVELEELDPTRAAAPSPDALDYIDEAVGKIRLNAYHDGRVDWEKAREVARAMASGAVTKSDAHPAASFLLRALKDGHSFFSPPSATRERSENTRTDDFGIGSGRVLGKAFVSVPGFSGNHPVRTGAFADELRARIRALADDRPCGWIVDLRGNTGGNMYPMLDGLVPLLGDGTLGYFVGRQSKNAWYVTEGRVGPAVESAIGARKVPPFLVDGGKPAIAVLTGPRTASSGEAVAVSFRERPDTRSFGQHTAGLSTANRGVRMSDGAMLLIMTSLFADRTGRTFGDKLSPDEFVAEGPKGATLEKDPVVIAASNWLDGQSNCRP